MFLIFNISKSQYYIQTFIYFYQGESLLKLIQRVVLLIAYICLYQNKLKILLTLVNSFEGFIGKSVFIA